MSTSKFERVLSNDDERLIIEELGFYGLLDPEGRKAIQLAEQAVLAKLAEQEPVAWAANAALQNNFYLVYGCPAEVFASKEALLNEHDKAEVVPLYTHPMPANGQANLDSSNVGQAIPDGWQLVPKEPTKEMVAAFNVVDEKWEDGGACKPLDHYKSMLAAAPTHKDAKQ